MSGILLIVLDGLGDRQHAELDGLTPLESATTPALDALASAGTTGLMWPLGPGRAPTSPLAHFVLFGYAAHEFPGRGIVEALGEKLPPGPDEVVCRVNFARTEVRDGALWIAERPDPRVGGEVNDDVDLDCEVGGVAMRFTHTGGAQGLLFLRSEDGKALSAQVTDADPLRADTWARTVQPFAEALNPLAAARTAAALNAFMLRSRSVLAWRPLDTALVKWPAAAASPAPFAARTGLLGTTLARGALYRGLADLLGMGSHELRDSDDPARDLTEDLGIGLGLIESGAADFVHVHTKWPDRAGHRKSPGRKREVTEALDAAIAPHLDRLLAGDIVVCVTADHQTPSSGPLYHSGGAVPLLVCGGVAGRDAVESFSEATCREGALGHILGGDLMPLLLDCADRSAFLGAERYTAEHCLGTATTGIVPLQT